MTVLPLTTDRRPANHGPGLAAVAFLAAFGSVAAGLALGNRWILPALNTLAIYPFYVRLIAAGRRRRAFALALLWAIFMSQAVIAGTCLFPGRSGAAIVNGREYTNEMFSWIRTGEGRESNPSEFLPDHARDLALFAVLAFLTAGLAALFMGAVLLNYMNFYVGSLLLESTHPLYAAALGWPPYAAIRVVGYILIATALSDASIGTFGRRGAGWQRTVRYAAAGFALVLLDVIIKAGTAAGWAKLLKAASGF
jgi:hypothetical protein